MFGGHAGHDKAIAAVIALTGHHQQPGWGGEMAGQLVKGRTPGIFHHLDIQKAILIGGAFQRFHLGGSHSFTAHGGPSFGNTCIIAQKQRCFKYSQPGFALSHTETPVG